MKIFDKDPVCVFNKKKSFTHKLGDPVQGEEY